MASVNDVATPALVFGPGAFALNQRTATGPGGAAQNTSRVDCSVNNAEVLDPYSARPVLRTRAGGNVAGGYNGGGVGNKSICGFNAGNLLPLASVISFTYTWQDLDPANAGALVVFANFILDVNGDGSALRIAAIDPAALPALGNGSTVVNGDGSKTTTWLGATDNLLIVQGLPGPPLPPGVGFVPPTVPGAPLPAGWPSNSYSVAAILAAYPACRLAQGSTGDGGMPIAPNVVPPVLLICGDSNNQRIRAFQLSSVRLNGTSL
jgi:hypothetical protein